MTHLPFSFHFKFREKGNTLAKNRRTKDILRGNCEFVLGVRDTRISSIEELNDRLEMRMNIHDLMTERRDYTSII